ncbi:hypothetical protein BC826DRAFT_975242 [Russula brevipes]|nr:hypothetical protein BC826DRAFT_975242 [Russula brevipes]
MADQPALGQDGQLLDATEIEWYHDPDDARPIPPSSHLQEGGRLAAALAAEKLDEYGNPVMSFRRRVTQPLKPRAITKRKRATVDDAETDVEDENFVDSSTEDGSDTDIDLVEISNEEVADILPLKTIPEVSGKGHTRTLKATTNSRMTTTPLKKKLFSDPEYKVVPNASNGSPGDVRDVHYRCFHGTHKVCTIKKSMRSNLNVLVNYLHIHVKPMYQLYCILKDRDVPPTPDEIAIASGKKRLDGKTEAEYFKKLKNESENIKKAFEEQQARANGAWDQEKFEQVLTEWIVACDQPFNEVEKQEFVTMMNLIPKRDGIKRRVMKMGDEIIEGVCEMFMKLKGKIIAIVMDNASNNNTLMTSLEWRCEEHGIRFSAQEARMRCMPHTIHLAAIKLLEGIGAIRRLKASVKTLAGLTSLSCH